MGSRLLDDYYNDKDIYENIEPFLKRYENRYSVEELRDGLADNVASTLNKDIIRKFLTKRITELLKIWMD